MRWRKALKVGVVAGVLGMVAVVLQAIEELATAVKLNQLGLTLYQKGNYREGYCTMLDINFSRETLYFNGCWLVQS